MNRSAMYATAIVVAHLLVNIVHGLAHSELHVGLAPLASIFVIVVVLVFPLIATGLLWTAKKQLGLILLSLSMLGSLLFGLYHHFLAVSPDHIHSLPSGGWGTTTEPLKSDSVEDWRPTLIASNSTQTLVTQNPIAEGRVAQPKP